MSITTICPKCRADNAPTSSFCSHCGTALGATMVQGNTVVAPSPTTAAPIPNVDVKTIVQRTRAAFGGTASTILPNVSPAGQSNQRELTGFVIDVSGSMATTYDGRLTKLEAAIQANTTMVLNKARIDPHDEIALIAFNSKAYVHLNFVPIATHRQEVLKALQQLKPNNGTDIDRGLKAARDLFDWHRPNVVRRVVLLTDGHGGHPLKTAEDLKNRGVVIDVVGIGDRPSNVDEKLLRKVASVIEGEVRYRFIKDHQTLVAHYTQLAGKTATA